MTTADATPAFDPKRPFRTRDGRVIHDFHVTYHGEVQATRAVPGTHISTSWDCDGTNQYGMAHLDLVNLPEAPPAEVESKGQTDAARLQRLMAERTDTFSPVHLKNEDAEWLFSLARRAALVPDAGAVECPACPVEVRDLAACAFNVGANRNVPHRLPEKLDLLAGAVARFQPFVDRHFAHVDSAPPTTPAPASPAGGEVGEAKIKRCVTVRVPEGYATADDATTPEHGDAETGVSEAVCWVLSGGTGTFVTEDGSIRRGREHAKRFPTKAAAELARKDIKAIDEAVRAHFQPEQCPAALQAAARVRAASPDGEVWRPIKTAPKDGTYIIGARLEDDELRDVGKYLFETRFGESGWLEDERGIASDLTHWRPLPLPPPPSAQPNPTPITSTDASGPEPDTWDRLRGLAPDATGGLSSEAFIREQRDAWPDATGGTTGEGGR